MTWRNFRGASARVQRESIARQTGKARQKVGGLLLPGAPPNRAYVRCLGGSSECNGVIVSTCVWPVTAEPYRAKTAPLPRSSILVRPHRLRPQGAEEKWWRRRVLPPRPKRLCHAGFIATVVFPPTPK